MTYKPKSEEQLAKEGLLEAGIYDFEVADTSDKPSKKGKAMYTLKLHVFDEEGSAKVVWDYIALGSNFGERKLRHAADACGLIETYNTGNLKPSDFQGKAGKVEISINDGNADYPLPKNAIKDYVKRAEQESVATVALPPVSSVDNDDIPF